MKISQIRELAEIVSRNGLTKLEIEDGDLTVRIERAAGASLSHAAASQAFAPEVCAAAPAAPVRKSNEYTVDAPMVGVFYAAVSPDSPPFVHVGSKVNAGDVLCIIEAMKLMNEIVADRDGVITDICAADAQVVEYGQTLFVIEADR